MHRNYSHGDKSHEGGFEPTTVTVTHGPSQDRTDPDVLWQDSAVHAHTQ